MREVGMGRTISKLNSRNYIDDQKRQNARQMLLRHWNNVSAELIPFLFLAGEINNCRCTRLQARKGHSHCLQAGKILNNVNGRYATTASGSIASTTSASASLILRTQRCAGTSTPRKSLCPTSTSISFLPRNNVRSWKTIIACDSTFPIQ